MTRPSGTPETSSGRKGSKQNSNGKPNNWATNWSPSNPRLHNEPVQRGSSLEVKSARKYAFKGQLLFSSGSEIATLLLKDDMDTYRTTEYARHAHFSFLVHNRLKQGKI